jgi:hypothetical protein
LHSIYSIYSISTFSKPRASVSTGDHPILPGSCRKMLSTRLTGSSSHLNCSGCSEAMFLWLKVIMISDIIMSGFKEFKENQVSI